MTSSALRGKLARWSSPEDALGVLVLCFAFPVVAISLIENGGWRGCGKSRFLLHVETDANILC